MGVMERLQMIDNLYSGVNSRRVRFSSSDLGSTLGSTDVDGFGIWFS